jgi:hypothetical protein
VIGIIVVGLVLAGFVVSVVVSIRHARSTLAGIDNGSSTNVTVPQWSQPPGDGTSPVVQPPTVPSDGVTQTSPVTATSGTQVYSDDFHDPGSGWLTGKRALGDAGAGATYSFSAAGYNAVVTGPYHYYAYVPFSESVPQISVATTATQDAGAPKTGGFGVSCIANYGHSNEMRYEFLVNNSGHWFIERRDGLPTADTSPSLLREGSAHAPSAAATSVVAVCARLASGVTNRVMLFVNGAQVADLLDIAEPDDGGWIGALMATGGDGGPTTVHFSKVKENRLGSDTSTSDGSTPDGGTTPDGTTPDKNGPNSATDPNSQLGSST